MRKIFRFLAASVFAAVAFAACVPENSVEPVKAATEIALNPAEITVEAGSQNLEVELTANGSWVCVNALDWITVVPKTGDGNAKITIAIEENSVDGVLGKPRKGELSFTSTATSATLVVNQDGNDDLLLATIPYSIDFCTSQENWTIEDKFLSEGLNYVWSATTSYGYKASAYINACFEAESWLISPEFNLADETACIMNFSHALNKGTNAKISVKARKDGGEWQTVEVPSWPAGTDWNFIDSGEINLASYCGGKLQLAFVYGSSDTDAPTWEIKTVELTNVTGPKFGVKSTDDIEVSALETSASVTVTGNVDWTASASEGASVEPASGKGGASIKVSFPKNESMTAGKEYSVTVATEADVETKSYTIKIKQAAATEAEYKTFAEIIEAGDGEYDATNAKIVAVAGTNTVMTDGTAYMFAYDKNKVGRVGQVVKLHGNTTVYNGCPEWNNPIFEVIDTVAIEHPEAATLDAAAYQSYTNEPYIGYIEVTGTKSGYYVYTADSLKFSTYSNETIPDGDVTVWGYTIGWREDNSCINLVCTSFESAPVGPDVPEAANISEANALIRDGKTNFILKLTNPASVTLKNGKNVFLEDETGGLLVFNADLAPAFTLYSSYTGTVSVISASVFNNLPEVTGIDLEASDITVASSSSYPCTNLTIAQLLADYDKYVNKKVKISGVTVKDGWQGSTDRNGVIGQGADSINVYAQVYTDEYQVKTGCEGDIVCWPTYYKQNKQVGFWPHPDGGEKTFFTVTKEAPEEGGDSTVVYKNCGEINAAILAGETSLSVDFENFAEVTLVNGKNVFIQDATGGVLLYGTGLESAGAYAGLRIKGAFTFTATVYGGVPEVTAIDGLSTLVKDYNPEYPCANITLAELLANYNKYVHMKVKLSEVSVNDGWQASAGDRNGVVAQSGDSINVYCKTTTDTLAVKTGCKGNIISWPTFYNTTKQLGFWPHPEAGKTFFTVTEEAPEEPGDSVVYYTTCAEVNAAILAGETSLNINFQNPVYVTKLAGDGKSIYLMDGDNGGAVLIYNASLHSTLKAAGVNHDWGLTGKFVATATTYKGLPEITAVDDPTKIALKQYWTYPCKNLTIAELLANPDKYLNMKAKIADVDVTDGWAGTTDINGEIAQGDSKVSLRVSDPANETVIPTGSKGSAVVWVGKFNNPQVVLWSGANFTASSIPSAISMRSTLEVAVDSTATLGATTNSSATITYTSSNEAVATVSADGVVTAVSIGEATITASVAASGVYTAASAECAVKVVAEIVPKELVYELNADNMITGSNNSYAGNCDVTIDGITWNVTGNSQMNPWRIGGKNLPGDDRTVYTKTAMSDPVNKVTLTLGSSNLTLNSVKLLVSRNADFSDATEYVISDAAANTSSEVVITKVSNAYFKFVLNVTVGSANKFVEFKGAKFEYK